MKKKANGNIYWGRKDPYTLKDSQVLVVTAERPEALLPVGFADWGYGGESIGKRLLARAILTHEFKTRMGTEVEEAFRRDILDCNNWPEITLTSEHISCWYSHHLSFHKRFDRWISKLRTELKKMELRWENPISVAA